MCITNSLGFAQGMEREWEGFEALLATIDIILMHLDCLVIFEALLIAVPVQHSRTSTIL